MSLSDNKDINRNGWGRLWRLMALLLFLLLAGPSLVSAQTGQLAAQADSAYSKAEYSKAVELYGEIMSKDGISSELCYNMGNAYARGGDYGNALVCYLKAVRLDPGNKLALDNINYIESKVYDSNRAELKGKKLSIERDSPSFFSKVNGFVVRDHLSDTWATWAAVSFVLFVVCVALYIFSRVVVLRKIGFFGGIVLVGVTAIALVFAFAAADYSSNEGVLTGAKVKLRNDATLSAKEIPVALTRGTRMTVLDSVPADAHRAEWYKVRLNSDFVGWVRSDEFKTVNL